MSRSSWRTAPLPPDWETIRRHVLERDRHRCQIRSENCTIVAVEVDHTGDPTDHRLEVLQAACSACHGSKTGRQAAAARRRKYQLRRDAEAHPGLVG